MSGPILSSSRGPDIRPPLCWPLLPVPDADGRLRFPDLESSVRQRIEAVLRTSPGEQLMRPMFGAGLELLVHQPNTTEVRARTQEALAQHIALYEPRILLDNIEVQPGADMRELLVTIAYRIRASGVATALTARVPVGGN
ncbi:MAG TPA: GPW/gp25 family protein [Allosphingosinicella sp.]|nr:GPW/gp25 family protein [Allosphingosinicella sp.]